MNQPPSDNPWAQVTITDEGWARVCRFISKHQIWLEPPTSPLIDPAAAIDFEKLYASDEEEQ